MTPVEYTLTENISKTPTAAQSAKKSSTAAKMNMSVPVKVLLDYNET